MNLTMKQIIDTMQLALNQTIEQDNADADKLSEVDIAFNQGWTNGMQNAIDTLKALANNYVIDNLDNK
jgi:20S proteasome alpha/beta subunit